MLFEIRSDDVLGLVPLNSLEGQKRCQEGSTHLYSKRGSEALLVANLHRDWHVGPKYIKIGPVQHAAWTIRPKRSRIVDLHGSHVRWTQAQAPVAPIAASGLFGAVRATPVGLPQMQ